MIIALEEHYWDRELAQHFTERGPEMRNPALQELLYDLGAGPDPGEKGEIRGVLGDDDLGSPSQRPEKIGEGRTDETVRRAEPDHGPSGGLTDLSRDVNNALAPDGLRAARDG